jgi:hypothetical protein
MSAGCGGATSQPGAFQVASANSSTLQSQFVAGQALEYVLGVSEPSILLASQSATACGTLTANQGLYAGQTLTSYDGRFTLTMQNDGNLVLYYSGSALWSSGTAGEASAEVLMQGDGNLLPLKATKALRAH